MGGGWGSAGERGPRGACVCVACALAVRVACVVRVCVRAALRVRALLTLCPLVMVCCPSVLPDSIGNSLAHS